MNREQIRKVVADAVGNPASGSVASVLDTLTDAVDAALNAKPNVDKRALDIRLHDRAVDMRREALEGVDVLPHVIKELRPPRPHRDDVNQNVALEVAPMQQMCTQRRRPAEIMRDNARVGEAPMA